MNGLLRRRRSALPRLALGLLATACAATATRDRGAPAPAEAPPPAPPSLEAIFLEPGVQGTPPRLVSVSADGTFALVRWSPPEEGAEGPAELRLLDLRSPDAPPGRGLPVAALLPPEPTPAAEPPPELAASPGAAREGEGVAPADSAAAWSHAGHLLAVARGRTVHLVDPARGAATPLVTWEPPTHVAFDPDDAALRVCDGEELLVVPVPAELPAAPLPLEACRVASADLESPAMELRWSRDLGVVVGADPTPRPTSDPGVEVWHLGEARGVDLDGVDGARELDELAVSPDGRWVFALEVDESAAPPPALVPDYLTPRVSVREARRELADDGPRRATPTVWRTATGERATFLPEPPSPPAADEEPSAAWWLDPVGWAPAGDAPGPARFALERRSADHRTLEIWVWTEGAAERLHVEHDPAWIGGDARATRWSADGRALLLGSELAPSSTTPGRGQLFALDVESGVLRQLTEVTGEVTDFAPLAGGGVLFQFVDDDPAERRLGFVPPGAVTGDAPAPPVLYAVPGGFPWDALAAADGSRAVFLFEELFRPAEVVAADAARAWRLTDTVPEAFERTLWVRPTRIAVRAPDGALVRAHVYLPPGTTLEEPGPPRAAIVFAHGAGYLQNVTDSMTRYPLNMMFHARLARLGYPVIDVDFRGSAGYGRDFRVAIQGHLGGKDLDDVHLVVDELVRRGVVDEGRVGIYGGSYGGFLALMALFTAPERWECGAALRPVTDWRTYHPRYTQPRLGRPSTDPEAYARSSPIDHVEGLADPLLLCHGLVDENVFAQDTIRLVEELIERGKEFDAMLYPSQGHAFDDGEHWLDEYRRVERFLLRHLGPPVRPGEEGA